MCRVNFTINSYGEGFLIWTYSDLLYNFFINTFFIKKKLKRYKKNPKYLTAIVQLIIY